MSEQTEYKEYDGTLPSMEHGEVIEVWGENKTRVGTITEHRVFVWNLNDGYQIAMKTPEDKYEIDEVTDLWNPNGKFYDRYRHVNSKQFPRVEDTQ